MFFPTFLSAIIFASSRYVFKFPSLPFSPLLVGIAFLHKSRLTSSSLAQTLNPGANVGCCNPKELNTRSVSVWKNDATGVCCGRADVHAPVKYFSDHKAYVCYPYSSYFNSLPHVSLPSLVKVATFLEVMLWLLLDISCC